MSNQKIQIGKLYKRNIFSNAYLYDSVRNTYTAIVGSGDIVLVVRKCYLDNEYTLLTGDGMLGTTVLILPYWELIDELL